MQIKLIPGTGAEIDGKRLLLGCSRGEAEVLVGKPESEYGVCYYHSGSLVLDYGKDDTLCYIECRDGSNAELYGVNVFRTDEDKLYEILAAENGDDISDDEDGYSYRFNGIGVSIWRESRPDSENTDEYEHWDTVGVFAPGYYG